MTHPAMELIRNHDKPEKQEVECSYCHNSFPEQDYCPYCFTDTLDTWLLVNFGEDGLRDAT